MTREHTKAMLPIFTAFAEGKTIQTQTNGAWGDISDLWFNADPKFYRVKPEPRDIWILHYQSDLTNNQMFFKLHEAEESRQKTVCPSNWEIIHFREVL